MSYNPIVTGAGTEAAAQRVTIATDSTGVLSIDDNGAAITVDGTVDLGATDNAVLDTIASNTGSQQTDGLTDTELRATAVPVSGEVTTVGKAAQGAAVSGNPVLMAGENPLGNVALLQTAPDGDLIVHHHSADVALPDSVSNTLRMPVNETDSGFMATANIPYYFNGTTWDRTRGDATDGLLVNLGANNDISGTVTANLSATDNAVLDSIDTAVNGTLTVGSHAVTNAGTFATQATLQAGTAAFGKLSANSGVDIGDVDVTSITGVTMSNAAIQTTGDEAHDAADAGNPVKIGMKAKAFDSTAPGTNVAEDDRVDAIATLEGRQYVETTHPNYWDVSVDYATAQTNATVKAAAGAGLKLYITDIYCSNGATAGNITLLDGSAGTVLWESYPAINGGGVISLRSPIALTANTLLAITSTTVTTHSLTICGYIAV